MKSMLTLALVSLTACKSPGSLPETSGLANVSIGELQAPEGFKMPNWQQLKIDVLDDKDRPIKAGVSFSRPAPGSEPPVVGIKLPYGKYKFLLSYNDATGKTLMENCEKSIVHTIETPAYSAGIKICELSGGTILNVAKESKVSVNPVMEVAEKVK